MTQNTQVLAFLWGGYTVLVNTIVLLGGLVFTLGCGPMFGFYNAGDASAVGGLALATGGVVAYVLVTTIASLSICWGLYRGARWGVWGTVALALLNLFMIPLGTALAIFTFVALRNELGFGARPE
jgi:hypothetical protein